MKLWIARDQNGDLFLYPIKPDRYVTEYYVFFNGDDWWKGWLITDLACKDNWGEMRGDIERHPYYTHYCPVPELPIEEDEE